jgi:type II secretory pathway component GspD/PulD (secretin)/tetratricopeptide (TPR) repeat protein
VFRAIARTHLGVVPVLLTGGLALLLAAGLPPQSVAQSSLLNGSPAGNPPPIRNSVPTDAKGQARSKLLQARTQLGQGNFDTAEALAKEVAGMNLSYRPDEDSPAKVMKDVASARTDAKSLLQAARSSLAQKHFDQAEKYARQAEKYAGTFTFPFWGDTPAKALKDITVARKAHEEFVKKSGSVVTKTTPSAKPPVRPGRTPPAPGPDETDKARALLKQARQALTAGQIEQAKKLTAQARSLKTNLSWWEDNPERVETDIHNIEAARRTGKSVAAAPASSTPAASKTSGTTTAKNGETKPAMTGVPRTKKEAKDLLVQGRKQLDEGKLDDAAKTAQRIKALTTVSWGLFEDSPDRLQIDIDKARVKRDRAESVAVLAEARKLYEKGDYDNASRLAYKAQKLHGPYSIMELGDRPTKLLAEIQTAQAKARKTALPPAVVAKNNTPAGGTVAGQPANKNAATAPGSNQTPQVVNLTSTGMPAAPANSLPSGIVPAPMPAPAASGNVTTTVVVAPAPAPAPVSTAEKLRAQQLLAEAQRLQTEGKLVEARQKVVEAQRLSVRFGPNELGPDLLYQQLSVQARQQVDGLVRQAHETASYGQGNAQARYSAAVVKLNEASQIARSFGQDTVAVDLKLNEIRALQSAPVPAPLASMPPPPGLLKGTPAPSSDSATKTDTSVAQVGLQTAPAASDMGKTLLDKARLELQKGETATARRMTESAAMSHPEVKDEAFALLRTIDAEEFNQKRLATDRGFAAAVSAYNRHEYERATAMIAAIDTRLLNPANQVRLREISMTPEMVALSGHAGKAPTTVAAGNTSSQIVQTGGTKTPATGTSGLAMASTSDAGHARATDAADGGLLDAHKQKQMVLMDKLRHSGLDAQRDAAEKFRTGQYEDAVAVLQSYLDDLENEKLDASQRTLLRRPVEARLSHYRLLKTQKELAAGAIAARKTGQERVDASRKAEEMKRQNVDRLMKEFNALYKEGKYLEAESIAMKASDLDPDNGVISAAVYMARRQRDVKDARDAKDSRERLFVKALNSVENEGPADIIENDEHIDKERWERARKRPPLSPITLTHPSEKEKAILRRLSTPTSLSFEGASLKTVINELRDVNGINIVIDDPALQEAGISLDSSISIKLDQVSLKSALNLILHKVHLTYVVKDEALQITTEEHAKGKLQTVTYQVADLVVPVENFGDVRTPPPPLYAPSSPNPAATPPTPVTPGPYSLGGGSSVGSSSYTPGGTPSTSTGPTTQVQRRSANNTLEDQLIKLITSTIQPKTWSDMGGPGTIDYHPLTMALVINQAADIQEQIAELLTALRRLQDQQLTVELRMISVTEDFFERVGVNFNVNIPTNSTKYQPALLNNSFVVDSTRFINEFGSPNNGHNAILGLTPSGSLTSDLNIPIGTQSFFSTVPQYGGYIPGGLTMGLAFLSDIQVFLFMEAVQGDQRANIMQAPKLTLQNGQTSSLVVSETLSFVQGVQVVSLAGGAQYSLVPQITPVGLGVSVTIQAVITADRRFVRLNLGPTLTNQTPGPIGVFPLVVPIFTAFDGTQTGQPVVFTQFIQQPNFQTVGVLTSVAVPDGGTVLLGGLKRLSEARSEYGPPILSKIPYINRLFKNVGYGRETESLLIMVTTRIIVNEEEEERQTGFRAPPLSPLP